MDAALVRSATANDRAAVQELLRAEHLEEAFEPSEFLVAEADGRIVGCGRLKPLPDGTHEIASVAVVPDQRKHGVGAKLVAALLARLPPPGRVVALARAWDFFGRQGFRRLAEVPAALREKAEGHCKSTPFVPMAWP